MLTNALFASAGDSFVTLFTEMSALVYVLFIVGFILCIVEMFTPGFGVAGTLGGVAVTAAIIVRMVQGGDMWMLLYMLLIATTFAVTCIILVARSIRQGKLAKSSMFNITSSVSTERTEGTKDYSALLGATGTTLTVLRPVGQANIEGSIVDVVANNAFIDSSVTVTVVAVEGSTIKVSPIK